MQSDHHSGQDCIAGVWTTHHRTDPAELLNKNTLLKNSPQLRPTVKILFQNDDCFKLKDLDQRTTPSKSDVCKPLSMKNSVTVDFQYFFLRFFFPSILCSFGIFFPHSTSRSQTWLLRSNWNTVLSRQKGTESGHLVRNSYNERKMLKKWAMISRWALAGGGNRNISSLHTNFSMSHTPNMSVLKHGLTGAFFIIVGGFLGLLSWFQPYFTTPAWGTLS